MSCCQFGVCVVIVVSVVFVLLVVFVLFVLRCVPMLSFLLFVFVCVRVVRCGIGARCGMLCRVFGCIRYVRWIRVCIMLFMFGRFYIAVVVCGLCRVCVGFFFFCVCV